MAANKQAQRILQAPRESVNNNVSNKPLKVTESLRTEIAAIIRCEKICIPTHKQQINNK